MHQNRAKLIIVCGLPGSGKTTLAKELQSTRAAIRFCPDEWITELGLDIYDEERRGKIEELQWSLGEQLLTQGLTVIVEWGTWGRAERDKLRLRARELGAEVELYFLSAPLEVLWDRIQRRNSESPALKKEDIARWFEIFQVPNPEEMALFDNARVLQQE